MRLAALLIAVPLLTAQPRFLRFDEVRDVLAAYSAAPMAPEPAPDAASWDRWIRERDRAIRARVDRGVEDSVSNLILFGTSFTSLPRLAGAEDATQDGELTVLARDRLRAFVAALAKPGGNERLRFARDFLARRASGDLSGLLSANLKRFSLEQRGYQRALDAAAATGDQGRLLFTRGTLFEHRGLSIDTSLLPSFAIEDTLRALIAKRALDPGRIRRIAVIGPGLDFADKRDGYDFYPLQTLQPFALMEAAGGSADVAAYDLNPAVLAHIRTLRKPYTIQLPRERSAGWSEAAVRYWEHFGDRVGNPATPLAVPATVPGLKLRAVAIRPEFTARLSARDLNIVAQTEDETYDLVVATNVLVYYNRLEQVLAMASIARIMNPGAVFLANQVLPAQRPVSLDYLGRRSVSYHASGAFGDDIVVYRKK